MSEHGKDASKGPSRRSSMARSAASGLNVSRQSGLNRSRQSGLNRSRRSLNRSNHPNSENTYCRGESAANRLMRNPKLDNLLEAVIRSKLSTRADNQNSTEVLLPKAGKSRGSVSSQKRVPRPPNIQDLQAELAKKAALKTTGKNMGSVSSQKRVPRPPDIQDLQAELAKRKLKKNPVGRAPSIKSMHSAAVQTSRHPSMTNLEQPKPTILPSEKRAKRLGRDSAPNEDVESMPVHNNLSVGNQINPSTVSIPSAVLNDFTLGNDNLMKKVQPPMPAPINDIVQLNQPSQIYISGSVRQAGRYICGASVHQTPGQVPPTYVPEKQRHIPTTSANMTTGSTFPNQTSAPFHATSVNQAGNIFPTSYTNQANGHIFQTSIPQTYGQALPAGPLPTGSARNENAASVGVHYDPTAATKYNSGIGKADGYRLNTSESTSSTATPYHMMTRPLTIGQEYSAVDSFSNGYQIVYVFEGKELERAGRVDSVLTPERIELHEIGPNDDGHRQKYDLRANVPLPENPDDPVPYNTPLGATNREDGWSFSHYNATAMF